MRDEMARIADSITVDVRAQLLIVEKRYAEALEHIPVASLQAGDLCLRLRRWKNAIVVFEHALSQPIRDNTHAHMGLARAALGQRKYSVAAKRSLDALQNGFNDPVAHYLLGLYALTGLKERDQAAEAAFARPSR